MQQFSISYFCFTNLSHVLETVEIETGYQEEDSQEDYADIHEHSAGTSLIVRYSTIKDHLDEGKVALLY